MKRKNILCWVVLALSVLSIVAGILNGECETVFTKATNVCLECIGIG